MIPSGFSGAFYRLVSAGHLWASVWVGCWVGLEKAHFSASVQEARCEVQSQTEGNANDNHVSLNRFYKLFISLASLDAWQFSLTSMSFILVLLSQTPLENDWCLYQLRTICSLLDNSDSVLFSLHLLLLFRFLIYFQSHAFFSLWIEDSQHQRNYPLIHFFPQALEF